MNSRITTTRQRLANGLVVAACSFFMMGAYAGAYTIIDRPGIELRGDFILEPAKVEVFLEPGESVTRDLSVINRTEEERVFTVNIEDTRGSDDPSRAVVLLGEERGPYSLRDYLSPEITEFTLEPRQQITLPVTISVPLDAEPGGLYGSVLVSSARPQDANSPSGASVVSRVGALYFVRVAGEVTYDSRLLGMRIAGGKNMYFDGKPEQFELLYENKGSIHTNPYGGLQVSNIVGSTVAEIEIDPFFAMPDSRRYRQVYWPQDHVLAGRYKVTAEINRGYDDIVDTETLIFWVIPWKILVILLGIILVISLGVRWFTTRFEFKRKDETDNVPQ